MPTTIKLKNSVTTTSVPSSLVQGEVAINITDKKVWVGNAATTPIQLLGGGADGNFTNISVSSVATFGAGTVSAPSITTTGDTNTGIYFPAADTIAFTEGGVEAMRLDSSGNLGIGASPSFQLDVVRASASTPQVRVQNTTTTSQTNSLTAANYAGALAFVTSNSANVQTERMRITSTGTVAIGTTTTPTAKLWVESGRVGLTNTFKLGWHSNPAHGDLANYITGDDSTNYVAIGTGASERMRIDSSGNVLVGATATSNNAKFFVTGSVADRFVRFTNSQPSAPFGVVVEYSAASPNDTGKSFLFCADNSATRADIRSNGGLANYSANNVNLSDAREKTNVELAGSYLDKICSIPVKTFNYIDQNREEDDGLTLGVIAQDVQAVAPELVTESDWGTEEEPKMRLSIYQTDLQYALMKSIQELKATVDAQALEIAALKDK